MRIIQRENHPEAFFLVAETEADHLYIKAIRRCGGSAIETHTIIADDMYDELIRDPAIMKAYFDAVAGLPGARGCGVCNLNRESKDFRICEHHRQLCEFDLVEEVVEVNLTVPCTCMLTEQGDRGYNPETGHHEDCLRPKAITLGMMTPDHRWQSVHTKKEPVED